MVRRLAFFAAVAATTTIAALAACGGDDTSGAPALDGGGEASTPPAPPPGSGDASLPPPTPGSGKDFCDKTWKAFFDAYLACCNAQDMMRPQYAFLGLLTVAATSCEQDLEKSIAGGRITIDPASAATCESFYSTFIGAGVCGKTSAELAAAIQPVAAEAQACNTTVVGLQAAGKPCAGDFECSAGLTCVGWSNMNDGVCQAPGGPDAGCGEGPSDGGLTVHLNFGTHPACATGNYCDFRKCTAQRADDAGCGADDECLGGKCHASHCGMQGPTGASTPCTASSDCQDGLYCEFPDGGFFGNGVCQPKEGAGSPCTGGGFLQTGQCKGLCDVPDGSTVGTCASFCSSG